MKRIYLILLPLFFVLTCSAKNGNNAEFQIRHGLLIDSENPKLTLDLEVMLKATIVNNKIQSITIVGYRYLKGIKWTDIEQHFQNQDEDGWVKIKLPAYPFVSTCNSLINANDTPIATKQILQRLLKANEELSVEDKLFCLFALDNYLVVV